MIGKLAVTGALAVLAAAGQGDVRHSIVAWFPDGTGVELQTETTGPTVQTSVQGAGMILHNLVHRIVVDNQNRIVFAYELEAQKAAEPGAVSIRLKPVGADMGVDLASTGQFGIGGDGRVPTVSAVREFRSVKKGQEVKIEILANPSTGEKVYDVLRPAEETNPAPGHRGLQAVEKPMSSVGLVVNGQALAVKSSWTAGKPARLYLPGHGVYYLSWENLPKFRLAGYAEKNRLIFLLDSEYVEITGGSNILTTAERGPVWVYHDPDVPAGLQGAELSVANPEALHAK
jgi:hypothetical protein